MSDDVFYNRYYDDKAKRDQCIRVQQAICANGLDYTIRTDALNQFITYCEEIKTKAQEPGYKYLSNFVTKITEDIQTMKKYRDYIADSCQAYQNLYDTLDSEITTLRNRMKQSKDAYNKDKDFWERIW